MGAKYKYNKITPELEEELLRVFPVEKLTCKEVQETYHVSLDAINKFKRKHGIKGRFAPYVSKQSIFEKNGERKCSRCKRILKLENFTDRPNRRINFCKKCLAKMELARYYSHYDSVENFLKYRLEQAMRRKKDQPCTLTLENLLEKFEQQKGCCYYTGEPLKHIANDHFTISLDRFDSSKGYTKENVVLCGTIINFMKQSLTLEQFLKYCAAVDYHFTGA